MDRRCPASRPNRALQARSLPAPHRGVPRAFVTARTVWRSAVRAARTEPMGSLRSIEQHSVERAMAEPMLDQVLAWSAINSGSHNLAGLGTVAGMLADAFAELPGEIVLASPTPV